MKPQVKKQVLVFMLAPSLPAVTGGDIYAINTVLPFADQIDYHLFCYVGGQDQIAKVEQHRTLYDRVFRTVHMEPRPKMPFELPKWRRALRMAWQVRQGLPFIDASYCSASAVKAARHIVREQGIDAIEVNSAHLAFFRKYLPSVPGILVSHNIEADIFPFWMPVGLRGWKLRFMEWVARNSRQAAKAVELENAYGFKAMTFISRQDMARVTDGVPKYLMPLHFPISERSYASRPGGSFNVLWMGGFGWYPNAEGVGWFVEQIYPLIKDKLQENGIVLHFCGGGPPEALKAIHDGQQVIVHGFVEDLSQILDKAHLLMVPLLSGGGIRVKIVEAMSAGIPVLSTSKGCEGIGATDDVNILIRDDAAEFATALLACSQQPQRMAELSSAGLRLMASEYSREASLGAKRAAYRQVGVL
ncbi:glycosyltransferase [Pseudoxanthomonas sp. USHLN014]|uniref:glycosyltransferase n=1 Tax=Pseudoxanthomonas TaxID=83618 RepID=UPI00301CF86B